MASETGKKGVEWRGVKVSTLSSDMQTAYKKYAEAYDKAKGLEQGLKDALADEWDKKFPEGKDGKVIAFNITGGKLQYAMKAMKAGPKKRRGDDEGDDVFSHP